MVLVEKSHPAPECLEIEKSKANGDYKCGNVLERIKTDFRNKCYICEYKEPVTINVEHFISHKGDKELKFDWGNLFWSCGHCNNTKSTRYDNILNCTDPDSGIENKLKYIIKPFPLDKPKIKALDDSKETLSTQKLLMEIYNGTTILKRLESSNLRNKIIEEVRKFQDLLENYFDDTNNTEDTEYYLRKIKGSLNRASNFTAFKRWIILENEDRKKEFEQYL